MDHLTDTSIHSKTINEINKIIFPDGLLIGINWLKEYCMISSDDFGCVWNNDIRGIQNELVNFNGLYKLEEYLNDMYQKRIDRSVKFKVSADKDKEVLKKLNS